MATLFVLLCSYLFVGFCSWFSPREYKLAAANLPWHCKIARCLAWPAYLLIRPSGFFLKLSTVGLIGLIIFGAVAELAKDKVYSLKPSDIKKIPASCRLEADLTIEEAVKRELTANKEQYLSAFKQENPDALAALVDSPAKAAAAIMLYAARNGVLVSDTLPDMKQIHNRRMPIDCYGAAVIAAFLLADDGFSPMFLSLKTSPHTFFFDLTQSSVHMAYVYKSGGRFGYISLQRTTNPIFSDLDALIADVSASMKVAYTQYFLFDFKETPASLRIFGVEIWRRTDQAGFWDYLL